MRLEHLKPAPGSRTTGKRLGRGIGSGVGKTSGKGHKGQKARAGGGVRPGFEGGQMPLHRRLPKRGFTNIFKKEWAIVNLGDLAVFAEGTVVTPELLIERRLVRKPEAAIKILAGGELTVPLTVQAQAFSGAAQERLAALGGKAEVI